MRSNRCRLPYLRNRILRLIIPRCRRESKVALVIPWIGLLNPDQWRRMAMPGYRTGLRIIFGHAPRDQFDHVFWIAIHLNHPNRASRGRHVAESASIG